MGNSFSSILSSSELLHNTNFSSAHNTITSAAARCWMLDRCCNFSCYTLEGIWLCKVLIFFIFYFYCIKFLEGSPKTADASFLKKKKKCWCISEDSDHFHQLHFVLPFLYVPASICVISVIIASKLLWVLDCGLLGGFCSGLTFFSNNSLPFNSVGKPVGVDEIYAAKKSCWYDVFSED